MDKEEIFPEKKVTRNQRKKYHKLYYCIFPPNQKYHFTLFWFESTKELLNQIQPPMGWGTVLLAQIFKSFLFIYLLINDWPFWKLSKSLVTVSRTYRQNFCDWTVFVGHAAGHHVQWCWEAPTSLLLLMTFNTRICSQFVSFSIAAFMEDVQMRFIHLFQLFESFSLDHVLFSQVSTIRSFGIFFASDIFHSNSFFPKTFTW